jgi:hypothetical protein
MKTSLTIIASWGHRRARHPIESAKEEKSPAREIFRLASLYTARAFPLGASVSEQGAQMSVIEIR